jgi:hypothetical protein
MAAIHLGAGLKHSCRSVQGQLCEVVLQGWVVPAPPCCSHGEHTHGPTEVFLRQKEEEELSRFGEAAGASATPCCI